jgi:DNA-binding CsgD family transcriptional regulator
MERPSDLERLRAALPITERESEVLLWIAHGKTNREIGTILDMSPRTANKHLEQIFRKLNVENRTAAAVIALKHLPS